MSAKELRICQTCGATLAPQDEFCPVCAFRGALQGHGTATEASEPPASRYGHYEILKHEDGSPFELGRGAMGITYKAFDVDLRRFAALKVISPRYLADQAARFRFLREARAAGSVRHPNVASVFQLGTSQEHYFYAMEFVEGETLGSLVKRSGCLDARLASEIIAQVAAGLEAIHKQNLVHRDIKPSNIMVNSAPDGAVSVRIIDLGLAKTLTESESQEISILGAFAGTPEFASPEQFTGTNVDIRSDLYSLGITLWQMLTGKAPFRGAVNEVMHQHLNSPLPLEKLRNVPQPAVALLEVLLRKEPARRFQSPAELLKTLPIVIDAIETLQPIRQTIRVFISFNGDLQRERNLANRIVRGIASEFDLPVLESGSEFERLTEIDFLTEHDGNETAEDQEHQKFALCLQFWDDAAKAEVKRLPDPRNFELVVCLPGNQVGAPVPPDLRLPSGGIPTSGTEYEIAWAVEHASRNQGIPVLRVYRNPSKPSESLEQRQESEASPEKTESVRDPLGDLEEKRKGTTDFNRYKSLEAFEEQFRSHFRDFVADQVKQGKRVRRWKSSPFRGLNVFDFEHAPIFFGRAKAIGEVLEALEQQRRVWRPFVLIVGGSGSGKSSLVRAGVLPQLIHPGTIEGIGLWRRAVTRPGGGGSGGDCFDSLANALLESAALPGLQNPESTSAVEELAAELRDHPDAVALRVRDALDNAAREWRMQQDINLRTKEEKRRTSGTTTAAGIVPRPPQAGPELPRARLALVIDQLEELFTSGFSADVQQKYVSAIAGLAQSHRVFILATLRSDFYSAYQQFPELTELTRPSGKVDLRPPTVYEIGNMIRLPAEAADLQFELDHKNGQRLDEGLRDAASTTPESLPLLQHVLSLLYDKQAERADGLLRWSDYRDLGELKGALAKYAETVFATLQSAEQLSFSLVMRHLVTLGQGEEEAPSRRTAPYREFVTATIEDRKSGAIGFVDRFIAKRLFIADTDPHGEVNVSVAHEALLREWERIREWLTENRDFLRMRDRLDSSLKLWLSREKQRDDLLGPGLPLAEGEKLLKDFEPSLSQAQTDYVRASIAEEKRKHRSRDRIRYVVMAGISAALIVAVAFGLVSYRQFRRAERSKIAADKAAKRATLARNEAEKLINFLTIDLRDKLKPIGRLDLLADVNQRVEGYYNAFPNTDDRPEAQQQRAVALTNDGDVFLDEGKMSQALKSYQQALLIHQRLVRLLPNNAEVESDLAQIDQKLGMIAEGQANLAEADRNYQEALAIRSKLLKEAPNQPERLHGLFLITEKIGFLAAEKGDAGGAEDLYRKAIDLGEQSISQNLAIERSIREDLSLVYLRLCQVSLAKGDFKDALHGAQKSLDIRRELVSQNPNNTVYERDLGITLEKIGEILSQQGNWNEAMNKFQECLAIREKLAAQDPKNMHWQEDLALSYEDLGRVLQSRGQIEKAVANFQNCLTIREYLAQLDKTNAEQQRNLYISYFEIGEPLLNRGSLEEALASYQRALEICQKLAALGSKNDWWQQDLALAFDGVGDVLKAQSKIDEALKMYEQALSIRIALVTRDSTNENWQNLLAWSYIETGKTLTLANRFSEAEKALNEALRIDGKLTRDSPRVAQWQDDLATANEKLGEMFVAQSKQAAALSSFETAIEISNQLLAQDPEDATAASTFASSNLAYAQVLKKDDNIDRDRIRGILEKARQTLLEMKNRTTLNVNDSASLQQIESALGDL
jgi:eukaryotic-like serine/threonine-protein kinase